MSLEEPVVAHRSTPSGEPILEAADLYHGFDGEAVLEGLDLTVNAGEVLAIIGPSGVGKSTLLRLLGLFERPDRGSIALEGTDVWATTDRQRLASRRRVGTVFQAANLFDASVRRNVTYGRRIRRSWRDRVRHEIDALLGRATVDEPVIQALETVGLADALEQDAASLSGGEAQRVAFARALAYDPDVLLLDEPTSDLDPRNTAVIEDAVRAARDRGIGVAIATHDMHQAERVADRTAVMLGGAVTEIGPTERVFESPRDDRTRQFIDGELVY